MTKPPTRDDRCGTCGRLLTRKQARRLVDAKRGELEREIGRLLPADRARFLSRPEVTELLVRFEHARTRLRLGETHEETP